MSRIKNSLLFLICALNFAVNAQTKIPVIDHAIFYDGYAKRVYDTVPEGLVRLDNDLVTTKLTDDQLNRVCSQLTIRVTISALCDNYDRIGNINLALVPKGAQTYHPDSVTKLEMGRFITPFMNKNKDPKSVEYVFNANNIAAILHNPELRAKYDFWCELEVFGVPYAANKQVKGCEGRNDVFEGKVEFESQKELMVTVLPSELIPVAFKYMLNNYEDGHTDELGKTIKTFEFTSENDLTNAAFYLITSNHGANDGGEEYIRRKHIVHLDGKEVLTYVPGGKSCEPYRVHNTQGNGIYERDPQPDSAWLAWNNWCPGDTISVREIYFDKLAAGRHTFTISVPDAEFVDKQGYFPVSLYLQGTKPKKKRKTKA